MKPIAIRMDGIGKTYRLGTREPYQAFRDAVTRVFKGLFSRGGRDDRSRPEWFWALKDLSLEIVPGEIVGIIGRNGAGKSTLLKVLSQVIEPTEGRAEVHGRIGSLLEVGTGFHPELTGRENIFFNGAILGMKRHEIVKRFDEIVAFAEVESFVDTPIKHYSSGMYMRLGFAVAAHLETEILLVDEVLAVGDVAFQRKCLGKMTDVSHGGRTVLFVSHNMGAIRRLCSRALWIDHGRVAFDGGVEDAIGNYMSVVFQKPAEMPNELTTDQPLTVTHVVLRDKTGAPSNQMAPGEPLVVDIHYVARAHVTRPHFSVFIASPLGTLMMASMLYDGCSEDVEVGEGVLRCTFESLPLVPQTYTLFVGVREKDGVGLIMRSREFAFFHVRGLMSDYGLKGDIADAIAWDSAPVVVPYRWVFPGGKEAAIRGFSPAVKP